VYFKYIKGPLHGTIQLNKLKYCTCEHVYTCAHVWIYLINSWQRNRTYPNLFSAGFTVQTILYLEPHKTSISLKREVKTFHVFKSWSLKSNLLRKIIVEKGAVYMWMSILT
jgi:hypothetical protein